MSLVYLNSQQARRSGASTLRMGNRSVGTLVMTAFTGMHDRANHSPQHMAEGFRQGTETHFRARCRNLPSWDPLGRCYPRCRNVCDSVSLLLFGQRDTRMCAYHVMATVYNLSVGVRERMRCFPLVLQRITRSGVVVSSNAREASRGFSTSPSRCRYPDQCWPAFA